MKGGSSGGGLGKNISKHHFCVGGVGGENNGGDTSFDNDNNNNNQNSKFVKKPTRDRERDDAKLFVFETPVERLDVGEDALPIGTSHQYHILHVQQRSDAGLFTFYFLRREKLNFLFKKKNPIGSLKKKINK